MPRILLILSVLPIAVCIVLAWWCGTRVLWAEGKRMCRCDLGKWFPDPDDDKTVHRDEATASEFGQQLRKKALAHWKEESPKLAKAREGNRAFGMIVPPFGGVLAIFMLITGKPALLAIAIFVGATAVSTVIGFLSLPSELTVIARYAKSGAFKGSFPNSYDEESVVACALAHAWESSLPPILKWLQPGSK